VLGSIVCLAPHALHHRQHQTTRGHRPHPSATGHTRQLAATGHRPHPSATGHTRRPQATVSYHTRRPQATPDNSRPQAMTARAESGLANVNVTYDYFV
jgi:hypothetical protein